MIQKMVKIVVLFTAFFALAGGCAMAQNAYDFSFEGLDGQRIELSAYKGKPVMVVNTASQCGFTPQYRQLEELYKKYSEKGLVVIGVPSNDFGGQEAGTNDEIRHFCQLNYGITFPMASKQIVKGDNAHPFYIWARDMLGDGGTPRWNFHKYLIGRDGRLLDYFASAIRPDDERIIRLIEKELASQ